jgi:hypothetical protein
MQEGGALQGRILQGRIKEVVSASLPGRSLGCPARPWLTISCSSSMVRFRRLPGGWPTLPQKPARWVTASMLLRLRARNASERLRPASEPPHHVIGLN